MLFLLSLILLLLVQSVSGFLSRLSRAPQASVRGWNSSGCYLARSSAPKPPRPCAAQALETESGLKSERQASHEKVADFSSVVAGYPRSPFSKVGIKLPSRTHKQDDKRASSEGQSLPCRVELSEPQNSQGTGYLQRNKRVEKDRENPVFILPESQHETRERSRALVESDPIDPWICIGRVSGAHGLRGRVKIQPTTFAKAERFCTRDSLLFFRSRGAVAPFVSRSVEEGRLLDRAGRGQTALVKLQGIDDRNAANSLAGSLVYVSPAQSIALLPPKCVLAAELIGFEVHLLHDKERTRIGRVTDVISKQDMRLREEALGAADDCMQIEVHKDIPGRRLLLQHFKDPSPPPAPLLASALHALGREAKLQEAAEDVAVLFQCEGCGLRFRDCTAAVCHERLCLRTSGSRGKRETEPEQTDALHWILQQAVSSPETLEGKENMECPSSDSVGLKFTCTWSGESATREDSSGQVCGLSWPRELQTLDGPFGRSGSRLGRRFWERLSLGDRVSWDRTGRFFPRKGEGAEEAAERALDFACNSRAGLGYMEADWDNPSDVTAISNHLLEPASIHPAACDADQKPDRQSFLLPFVLGVTVDEVNTKAKTLGINAPPALLH